MICESAIQFSSSTSWHKVQNRKAACYSKRSGCVQCTSTQSANCNDVQLFCILDKLGCKSAKCKVQYAMMNNCFAILTSLGFSRTWVRIFVWALWVHSNAVPASKRSFGICCFWTRCVLTALEIKLFAFCRSEITNKYSCVYNSKHSGILRESNNSARNRKRIW